MSISLFSKYPIINYDLYGDGAVTQLTNITQEVAVNASRLPDDASMYTYYNIQNGDRPDTVSYDLYGDVQYYWTFFVLNSFLREGLNDAWPLSYLDFNTMIEKEYSPYSVITFQPLLESDINGTYAMDFSITTLDSKYLPYLRLKNSKGDTAKILKFDSVRQQLIIYDISSGSRDSFISSPQYKLFWDDSPINISSKEQLLRTEWLNSMVVLYDIKQTDSTQPKSKTYKNLIKPSFPPDNTEAQNLEILYTNIFEQTYYPVVVETITNGITNISYPYNWSIYYNAACTYYDTTGNIKNVYDLIGTKPDKSMTIQPIFKSFSEVESDDNDSKRQIKIIRADGIADFSSAYFSVLTS